MKKYKNILMVLGILLCLIIVVHQFTYTIDKNAINNGYNPKFIIKYDTCKDGGTTVYYGLGYQIISWHAAYAKNENNLEKHGYLIGVEIHRFPFYNNLEKGGQPKVQLSFVEN